MFSEAVEYLLQNNDPSPTIEPLPYIPSRTRPIIYTQTMADEKAMKQPQKTREILRRNLSGEQNQRELTRVADKCSVEMAFEV